MEIEFLDQKHVERYRDVINRDPEFQMSVRQMSEDIRIKMGETECIFRIADDALRQIKLENTYLDSCDFSISASGESWSKFLQPVPPPKYTSLFGAMTQGYFRIEGDLAAALAYYWAVQRMFDVIRAEQSKRYLP